MSDAPLPTNRDIGLEVSSGITYPGTFSTPIEFANPDSMLSGTLRGTQFVGSNTLQIDSTQNLITIKNSAAALNQTGVLRVGTVSQNYLGMAVNNGTVDTMFAGQDSTGATVIKIAKAGFDAKTATNDQLVFNSSQNTFKIVLSGTTTIPIYSITSPGSASFRSGSASAVVLHNLGTIPAVLAFYNNGGSSWEPIPRVSNGSSSSGVAAWTTVSYTVDTSSIIFTNSTMVYGQGYTSLGDNVKYYVLQETAN